MTSMVDDVPDGALIREASRRVAAHWVERRWPAERVCPECTGTDCPRLRADERYLKSVGVAGLYAAD